MYFNDRLKETISRDFDKSRNLNIIKERIEENNKMKQKNNLLKYAGGFVCLVVLTVVGVVLSNDNNTKKILNEGNDIIYINKSNIGAYSLDADIKFVDINEDFYTLYPFIKNIVVPKELNNSDVKAIYTRENINIGDYNILHDYVLIYESFEDNVSKKNIKISFSKNYEPLRDYFIESKNGNVSKINNVNLEIYQYEDTYLTVFKYSDINFDIETNNISEKELIDLLKSIIK